MSTTTDWAWYELVDYHDAAMRGLSLQAAALLLFLSVLPGQQPAPAASQQGSTAASGSKSWHDANGNTMRRAEKTGHVTNYDESKVGRYTLPDPLILANGKPVRDAATWRTQRRPEILRLYETQIYGRVPATAPKVEWSIGGTSLNGSVRMQNVLGKIGNSTDAPIIQLNLKMPTDAKTPVPIILLLNFRSNDFSGGSPLTDPPVAIDIISRGWGYATVGYQDIQPDNSDGLTKGVIGIASSGHPRGPDDWGAISAWAWGVSRVIDYLETDKSVDAKRIAVFGHSRLGKTALWASALDERIAVVYSSCAGEMGSALARRDYGETIDDMAQNFPYQFAENFQKWVGRWNDMPVDAHMLIALNAPRPVFITGGTQDQWADPRGEFLAEAAAGPVYRLLGKKDLGTDQLPPVDIALTSGDLGWYYHTGPHAATAEDWKVFLNFLGKYF